MTVSTCCRRIRTTVQRIAMLRTGASLSVTGTDLGRSCDFGISF